MKVHDAGHTYSVDIYDSQGVLDSIIIHFMKRIGGHYPGNTGKPHEGTNCQEVLRVLIDRVKYLDAQIPCVENQEIIRYLRWALCMFEVRAARIHGRKLTVNTEYKDNHIEDEPTCKTCGHIECQIKEHDNAKGIRHTNGNESGRVSETSEVNKSLP